MQVCKGMYRSLQINEDRLTLLLFFLLPRVKYIYTIICGSYSPSDYHSIICTYTNSIASPTKPMMFFFGFEL